MTSLKPGRFIVVSVEAEAFPRWVASFSVARLGKSTSKSSTGGFMFNQYMIQWTLPRMNFAGQEHFDLRL
jgi:hypothetical protein